jgi:hypothetical protein
MWKKPTRICPGENLTLLGLVPSGYSLGSVRSWYPPSLTVGVQVERLAADGQEIEVVVQVIHLRLQKRHHAAEHDLRQDAERVGERLAPEVDELVADPNGGGVYPRRAMHVLHHARRRHRVVLDEVALVQLSEEVERQREAVGVRLVILRGRRLDVLAEAVGVGHPEGRRNEKAPAAIAHRVRVAVVSAPERQREVEGRVGLDSLSRFVGRRDPGHRPVAAAEHGRLGEVPVRPSAHPL